MGLKGIGRGADWRMCKFYNFLPSLPPYTPLRIGGLAEGQPQCVRGIGG